MLATLQALRQFTLNHPLSCRAFSTSVVAREGRGTFTLPPVKLRALVTLYHRSSTYITPANLSSRIDKAFTGESSIIGKAGIHYTAYPALKTLVERCREKSNRPNLEYKGISLNPFPSTWSGRSRGERQALVNAALWGIEFGGRPSLETVQETRAANEELGKLFD